VSRWDDAWWDRFEREREELKAGVAETQWQRDQHRKRAFETRFRRPPATAELVAMELLFRDQVKPEEYVEGQQIRESGVLSFVFDVERAYNRENNHD
jgi:hypothetical protein